MIADNEALQRALALVAEWQESCLARIKERDAALASIELAKATAAYEIAAAAYRVADSNAREALRKMRKAEFGARTADSALLRASQTEVYQRAALAAARGAMRAAEEES